MEASDERTLQRIEAFSDIVIGFSLAQLGASKVFTGAMTLNPSGAGTFFATFAILCSLWYFHHRLFQNFFVPKSVPIILNFIWLAVVVLLVFVSVGSTGTGSHTRPGTLLYFRFYALAYLILTVQTAIGVKTKQIADPELRFLGMRQLITMAFWTLIFIVCITLVEFMPWTAALSNAIVITFACGVAGSVAMGAYFRSGRFAPMRDSTRG